MRKLNRIQRNIILASLILFAVINLFPPWVTYTNPPVYDISQFIGYRFILNPPQSPFGYESYVVIDFPVLFSEWALFFVFLVLALILFRNKPVKK